LQKWDTGNCVSHFRGGEFGENYKRNQLLVIQMSQCPTFVSKIRARVVDLPTP